jgi:hypothetical protein
LSREFWQRDQIIAADFQNSLCFQISFIAALIPSLLIQNSLSSMNYPPQTYAFSWKFVMISLADFGYSFDHLVSNDCSFHYFLLYPFKSNLAAKECSSYSFKVFQAKVDYPLIQFR